MKSSTGTATTATAEYVGRFAPSPTGDLHLGSLYTAAASYLDARAQRGRWLVRMEDVDQARERPGAAATILRTLDSFGFEWDGPVVRQSERGSLYADALQALRAHKLTFECSCTRASLRGEARYPGTCRAAAARPSAATATRLRIDSQRITFTDGVQGSCTLDAAEVAGDAIIRRRDGVFAYLLAVVVDDAAQGVTDVVRGADLLEHTPVQLLLQRHLALPHPRHAHVPVLTEPGGAKLAKSARSVGIATGANREQLLQVLALLGLPPAPAELPGAGVAEIWRWAIAQWRLAGVPRRRNLPLAHR